MCAGASASTPANANGANNCVPAENESYQKIEQLGGLEIGDNVEIGAGCTIDRGAISNTMIFDGVKLDNQIHIAHNVSLGV